jgi:hypothetical protein
MATELGRVAAQGVEWRDNEGASARQGRGWEDGGRGEVQPGRENVNSVGSRVPLGEGKRNL